jgi:Icc-related predicted phosphoesterase
MRVALTSDTHGMLPEITGVDAVIHAGDIGPDRDPINWYRDKLFPWARRIGVPIYATFGNHDRIGEAQNLPDRIPPNLYFVVDALAEVLGVQVWFSPWSNRFGDWAFMANDSTLAKKYALIPASTEVIVTHGPPFGYGDLIGIGDLADSGARVGSQALARLIHGSLPLLKLVVTGHIHEAFGDYEMPGGEGQPVRLLNVSYVNEWYEPTHDPVIIDWPCPSSVTAADAPSETTSKRP